MVEIIQKKQNILYYYLYIACMDHTIAEFEMASIVVVAALEGMTPSGTAKDNFAQYIIQYAQQEKLLTPDKIIIDVSAGSSAIAMAYHASQNGFLSEFLLPEATEQDILDQVEECGGKIHLFSWTGDLSFPFSFIQKKCDSGNYYWPNQFYNNKSPNAYHPLGEDLSRFGPYDYVIACVGTGGTLQGVASVLKKYSPEISVVGVMTLDGSIPGVRPLGLDTSMDGYKDIFDRSIVNEEIGVTVEESEKGQQLLLENSVVGGLSSGAAITALQKIADMSKPNLAAIVLADGKHEAKN